MTKQSFLSYCLNTYGTSPDYPFDEDFDTAVLRHADNRNACMLVYPVHLAYGYVYENLYEYGGVV